MGPSDDDAQRMLRALGFDSLDALVSSTVPANILSASPLGLAPALSESEALASLRDLASKNRVMRSYIGMGYHETLVPAVIQRNMLE